MIKIKKSFYVSEKYENAINFLCSELQKAGYEIYVVGGAVRDLLLGTDAYDYDFTTNARPEQVSEVFSHTVPTGIKHGTVTILIDGLSFELTTYRCDGKYSDGRHPDKINYSESLEEDVARRDFTINGIAYDWQHKEVIDYVGGLDDLENKIIRTIGDPVERLSEDGLRAYRACRFASKLDFEIDINVIEAISKTLNVSSQVSVERIRDEIFKILQTMVPSKGIEYLRKTGLLRQCLPELDVCFGVDQNKYHKFDVYYHSLYSCDAASQNKPLIRLAALFHDIGKVTTVRPGNDGENTFYNHEVIGSRMTKRIMKRLKFSNEEIEKVAHLVNNHMFHYTHSWTDGAVRRFMRKIGVENLDELIELRLADRKGNGNRSGMPEPIKYLRKRIEKVIEEENAISVKDLKITGYDIMSIFSVKPGPLIGIILNELLEKVLDDPEFNTTENLEKYSEEIFQDCVDKSNEKTNKKVKHKE